jgi:hypothetical protein
MHSGTDDDGPAEASYRARLVRLVESDAWLMALLAAGRSLGLGEWCIAAGAVRNKVWDHLHGHAEPTRPSDVDFLFYDRARPDAGYEAEVERRLAGAAPGVRWEAVNQATVHAYTRDPPQRSIEEAMSRWADPVTAVGVRLTDDGRIIVLAPHGLADLFGLIVRPNLAAPDAAAVYRERLATKRWAERWPRLTIVRLETGP